MVKISGFAACLCTAFLLAACGSDGSDGGGTAGSGNSGAGQSNGSGGNGNGNAGRGNASAGSGNGSAGGGSSGGPGNTGNAVEACKNATKVLCEKFWTCFPEEQLSQLPELVGTDQEDCETKIMDCSEEGTKCDPGTSYNAANASQCLSDIKGLECSDLVTLAGGSEGPAACNQVCD